MLEFSQSYVFPFSRQAGKVGHIDNKYSVSALWCSAYKSALSGSGYFAHLVIGWKAAGFNAASKSSL